MITLVVVSNGRLDYLEQVIESARQYLPRIPACVLVDDSGDPDVQQQLVLAYPGYRRVHHKENLGMARAVQSGWTEALSIPGTEFIFHLEEDMEMVRTPPLAEAIAAMRRDPTIAQMCFRREPWWGSPLEMEKECQLAAIVAQASTSEEHAFWTTHDFLFSLNPCLIPRRILELGWPEGPLGVGNESGMTRITRELGYKYGSWGLPGDGQVWARHIGELRGAQWQL